MWTLPPSLYKLVLDGSFLKAMRTLTLEYFTSETASNV